MAELIETRFREAGRGCGALYVRLKPIFEYVVDLLMIAYQCYDCVSDGINVHAYYEGDSLDVSSRDDRVYRAFLFSLLVSCVCALASIVGYILLVIGLSKKLYKHQEDKNNTYKLGRLIVFISLICQVSFEETIQCVVMYYYIVRCSVIFSFWKTSLFVCTTLSLVISCYTFFKAAYLWFKKQDSLPRKYPSCLAPCYNLEVSHVGCVILCVFASLLTLALFSLNIVTLVDIIKYSEVDVPHVFAKNRFGNYAPVKITQVKKLVKSHSQNIIEKIPCANSNFEASHFLGDHSSLNCTTAVFTLNFAKHTKKLNYKLQYCYKADNSCVEVKATNITLDYTHDLCSPLAPAFDYLGDPRQIVKTTSAIMTKQLPSNSSNT
ncbi:Hypothetical predicted protein [Paramuricea clavata]|uniref:Uncharacterized protein n=1 Tax=Paramuricea clavata TaxID=317549 RepID=A0A6S7GT26_PARCT|nr:Hypothetical predicted protein [Paramuricea clavata]